MTNKYKMMYSMDFIFPTQKDYFTEEEVKKIHAERKDIGACDALIVFSILRNEEETNIGMFSGDGETKKNELEDDELFHIMVFIARILQRKAYKLPCIESFLESCLKELDIVPMAETREITKDGRIPGLIEEVKND